MRFLFIVLVAALMGACGTDPQNLPNATGNPGDIFIVMDSSQWRGPLGRSLDSIFSAEMPTLPRPESIFRVRWIDPIKLNSVLKRSRNLIFVMSLDKKTVGTAYVKKLFTPESIEQIKTSNSSKFSTSDNNVFAKNQVILYLYSNEEKTLLQNIRSHSTNLVDFLNQKERDRLSAALFRGTTTKGIRQTINQELQCDMQIPFGYKVADRQKDFIWLRQSNPRDDKDIFITRKPYVSPDDFKKENIIRFRDQICAKYLFGDPDRPESYLLTETRYIPVVSDTLNFNKNFAMRIRGLFRSNDLLIGGPFEGIAIVDEVNHQFYYIEGFTISPGVSQREIMRELETILYSFKPSKDLPKTQ